jgi:hypothetical protein
MRKHSEHHEEQPAGMREHLRAMLWGAALAGAVALLTWVTAARAMEYTAMLSVAVADAEVAAPDVTVSIPAGWQSGDTAAMVIVGGADRDRLRAQLIAELLAARVTVIELTVAPDLADPVRLAADAWRALDAVGQQVGPGAVALYGFAWDVTGAAAVLAQDDGFRRSAQGRDALEFAAHVSLGAGCLVERGLNAPATARSPAILLGEAVMASDDVPDQPLSEIALACGLATMPTPGRGELDQLPTRAAR